jgi:hypothetical protein
LDDLDLEEIEGRYCDYCSAMATQYAQDAANRKRRGEQSVPMDRLERLAAGRGVVHPGPARPRASSHRHKGVWRTLRALIERHRTILRTLMRVENVKLAAGAIAAQLGISKEAARKRLGRAMNRFRVAFLRLPRERDDPPGGTPTSQREP